jgi:hypothetical protein
MDEGKRKTGQAGGSLLAAAIISGTVGGVVLGQPSIGFLAGLGLGAIVALLLWLKERR